VFIGENKLDFEVPGMLGVICSFINWNENYSTKKGFYPLVSPTDDLAVFSPQQVYFLSITDSTLDYEMIRLHPNAVLVLSSIYSNQTHVFRDIYMNFANKNIKNPIILCQNSTFTEEDKFQLYHSSELGSMFIDGFGDGIWIKSQLPQTFINSTCFGILQATRTRISKTEYISCPSCGRTLFDLQETTGKIRKVTSHLKGIKIGIMGCIVNGPGEMADADYGYVGTGPGKINLYKEKEVVRKNISEESAVEELINLIKENGDWREPMN
jgi:(E)-4-hydroxy-3-methylbut-2-enyl-diphosphate synthase